MDRRSENLSFQQQDGHADQHQGKETGQDARGLSTIETSGDNILANCLKKTGMVWTTQGAGRMARVIQLRANDEPQNWIRGHASSRCNHNCLSWR